MVPDLAPLIGARTPELFDEFATLGLKFHLETDAVFHQSPYFVTRNRNLVSELRAAGIRKGPARAIAHLGLELLIDASLLQDDEVYRGYLEGLNEGLDLVTWRHHPLTFLLYRDLIGHLSHGGRKIHEPSEERLRFRMARALGSRPALCPTDLELEAAAHILNQHFPEVCAEQEKLWGDLSALLPRSQY